MGAVSIELLIRLARDQGHPEAMFRLAFEYKHGLDVEQDLRLARRLLWQAARSGHMLAMWQLAICFSRGKWGFPPDQKRAGYWYLQLWKKWLEDAASGDLNAGKFLEIYQIEKIRNPWARKQLGLQPA